MATKNYNTRTASLRATIADVRVLDAKKMNLDGKNILEYIKESVPTITYTKDTRETVYTDDLWGQWVENKDDGTIVIHDDYLTNPNSGEAWLSNVKAVQDNKAYSEITTDDESNFTGVVESSVIANIQTEKIKDGSDMFNETSITSFSGDLSNLLIGDSMFSNTSLASFNGNLSSLVDGTMMFYDTPLTSFSDNLKSLVSGNAMFYMTRLTSFSEDLSSLVNAFYMFYDTPLTSFSSDLSSLANGTQMFSGTKLDAPSVANIIHSLSTHETGGEISIGIGCDNTEADQLLFAQECDCENWYELLSEFYAKNWTVTFQCNGRPTTTYNMRRGETLPIYAKLIEVIMPTDENERTPHYAYTSADGSKFYNINYFHSTNGSTEGYDVFSSLEEAISTYNVTPKN